MKFLSILLCVVLLTACVPRHVVQRVPFPEQEYAALSTKGTASIKGQAFLKTRGGSVITAAGNTVSLSPVTSYSRQWYETNYLQGYRLSELDQRMLNYSINTIADGSGRFHFKNVPAGQYYIDTMVTWEVGYSIQGGVLAGEVSVPEGGEVEVILTR